MQITEQLKHRGLEDKECFTYPVLTRQRQKALLSAIQGLVYQNRKTISQNRLSACESSSQVLKSLGMLDRGSVLNERDSEEYWKKYYKGIQSHLLSHTEIDCADSDLRSSNSLLSATTEKSWFSTIIMEVQRESSQKIYSQYFMSSLAECTGYAGIVSRSRKIRIYPTEEQKHQFRHWIGVQRMIYNLVVEHLKKSEKKGNWMSIAKQILSELPDFCRGVPYQVKKIAVRDAFQAFSNNVKKVKSKGGKFELRYKSRKNPMQSCFIPKSAITEEGLYYTKSGTLNFSESLPDNFCDSRLVCDRGRWYISVPYEKELSVAESQGRVVAIDPGIRSFVTFFSEDSFGHIGHHDFGRIVRLCHHLDDLISRSSKENAKRRRAMIKAMRRIRWKISDLISELHHKAAKFLVDNFDVIFLPKFESKNMCKKAGRKISSKNVRNMLTYSFHKFAQHLKCKCEETGKLLVRVNESYTSKINSFTGKKMNIGSKEYFMHEKRRINRDINGARNILCFSLGDTPCVRNYTANVSES